MQNIPLPNKVYFAKEEGNKSVLVMEPLYPGYGVTIGNALRRVLLSSLPGAAVTAVKIKGVDHEFSTVSGVREDVVDIILNLKHLRFRLNSDEAVKLELRVKGAKEVFAKDIKMDSRVEIINPDLHIATLDNSSSEISMEITVEQGRGYVPVEMRETEKNEIGVIAIDAVFSPIRNVNFEVENVRVGQMTNFDKLTLTMETDGTISGKEAVDIASRILVDHFSLFLTQSALPESEQVREAEGEEEAVSEPVKSEAENKEAEQPVEEEDLEKLGLSNRAFNALLRNNIRTVKQLKGMDREQLENLDGLGAKSIDEIMNVLEKI